MKRHFVHILSSLLLAVLLVGACVRHPVDDAEQYGALKLQIGAGSLATKSGETDPRDGDVFHNILVVVADKDGMVKASVLKEYPCTEELGNVPSAQEPKDVTSTSTDWIYFMNLKVGYYQVYAYANIDQTAWQQTDVSALTNIEDIAATIISGTSFPDRQFATLTDSQVPAYPGEDEYMLLTGHDELYVGVDPYIGRIDLYRPVVKFEVVLDNHTPFHLQLTSLSFNKFNASKSFLIEHLDGNGAPVIPEDNSYRELPAFVGPKNIGAYAQSTVYSELLYENRIGQDYRMFATVQFASSTGEIINDESGDPLVDPNDDTKPLSKTLSSNSVRRVPYEDILNLPRGGSMNVLMVTPNTGNGGFLGYYPPESRLAFEQATYNFEESFRSKAESLLGNATMGSYYQLTLTKESDADKYHVFKGTKDLFSLVSGVGNSGLSLAQGYIPTEYPVPQEFAGSLCRFTKDNKSLFYKDLALKLDSNASVGNRMWTFYEIHPEGTVLKLIDRESSRVSTLTQMIRGQKLTAVMNVYYESETGEFTFSLDNTYWEEGHNSKHMFQ